MKSRMKFAGFVTLLIFIVSCSDKAKTDMKEISLDFKPWVVDGLTIGNAYGMLLADSDLLIMDPMADSLFHWVNLDNLTSKTVGRIGQGPGEFLHFGNFYYMNGKGGFYDNRMRSSNEVLFSINGIRLVKKVCHKSKHFRLVPTAFNTFIGTGPYENGLFSISDSTGKIIKIVGEYPYRDEDERKVPELARAMAYQGDIAISPKGDYLVHAIFMSPIISFYKLLPTDVELLKSQVDCYPTYRPELGNDSYASAMSRSNILGFIDVAVTDKCVYALLSGRSTEEAGLSAFMGNEIRVYDWNGNLLNKYICNTDLKALCVSSDDKVVYAVGLVDDYELLKAEL